MTQVSGAVPAASVVQERDPHLDNTKAVLIALVVVGHTVGQVIDSYPPVAVLYSWIYLFHMPTFVFLCGLLTRSPDLDGARTRSIVRTLLVPYVVFQVAFTGYYEVFGKAMDWGVDRMLSPLYHLWFLVALLLWRMVAPFVVRLRFPLSLTVVGALLAGTSTTLGPAFALNRAVAFLPLFVLGMLYGRSVLRAIPATAGARAAAIAALAIAVPVAAVVHRTLGVRWLYWNASYEELGVGLLTGIVLRSALLGMAVILLVAVLVLVPRSPSRLSGIGRWSMYPYLLHPFASLALAWSGYEADNWWEVAVLAIGAVALTAALAAPWVRRLLRPVVEPRVDRLFMHGR